ncbi:DNA-binding FadR family transcriptional regulator [Arthrobacter stackebrandtii]|uniref:DNA-binding FadR family transcriptional regulator n=1 Tax=Arthrobacter stackebrandtii TaxID=272161 RepID=A0ABS4YSP9_9MICC|nr:GntR family transcriptional regulator [Arthrobacter stackebrandtii]MBP2411813.1 DNA-binding FadR family transcriptional regulator [Arthrobacter stackebrandtii]PYG99201.1 FadR family transcriptional regulator [Arthrobacter stackebrandtii]
MSLSPLGASRSLAAVFTPIKSGGLVDEVCRRIELAVESGLLASGQRLPNEIELAAALGVSAVTAREALSQLRGQGLIRTTRGRSGGSFVTENSFPSAGRAREKLLGLTRLQITDLGLHFQAIAVACAGVAARRSSTEDVEALRQYIRPETAAGESATAFAWRLSAAEFLLELASVARSARLARELLHLQADVGTMTLLPFEDPGFCEKTAAMNHAITEAVATHDSEAAEARTKELTTATTNWLLAEHSDSQNKH